ncbi:family 65 glycosyl hydrolase domain-containing protein [uncultured Arcticibacterium sp.]|uniref:family 65 glycosyl hydrolase domain-containing protein n=1 Tax=uncultured Arcticibacterium sp. TaxID=2173042 RepID=UPI0030F8C940
MKNYIKHDPWCIIEEGFHPEYNEVTESLMSLGNGRMGQRGSFEETYSGKSLQGNYIAGVWYPDKTKVGWWKNGYPNYFAKVINAINWNGLSIQIDGVELDLATCEILSFWRTLNMKDGTLKRVCTVKMENGHELRIESVRFCSMSHDEAAVLSYSITPLNFAGKAKITAFLDGDVSNRDSNHGEKFWEEVNKELVGTEAYLTLKTKESPWENVPRFTITSGMRVKLFQAEKVQEVKSLPVRGEKYVGRTFEVPLTTNIKTTVQKYVCNLSSENHAPETQIEVAKKYLNDIAHLGFEVLLGDHKKAWEEKWNHNDIQINGDIAAQQGIRFNIFHLEQTYTGKDARLNIGPKGFTGEKYGGVTYWDTEAYCIPFYLATAPEEVSKNLLVYRHNHLQKAIENAELLGFSKGAALYPMVTMNGEECHNEWEITFEEIHRNGAIAYAIHDYINYTGDKSYLKDYGLDVLIGISRFWAQRVNWSEDKKKYVMLGVTGPNEYENNVNNNWYTNYMAKWTLKYTLEALNYVKENGGVKAELNFDEAAETEKWKDIIENMYFPYDTGRQVFLQQDGFLDKELIAASDIEEHRPINQKWSWDRILRSCFIKQADVLQGMYFHEDDFSKEELERNFDFYEPMTVHESSLSPCVHTILACKLGRIDKADEMYVRTARLDLDDYNNDTEDGLHITSMAGTWMAVVKGFGGMRVKNGKLSFNPVLPGSWDSYSFRVGFQGTLKEVTVNKDGYEVKDL